MIQSQTMIVNQLVPLYSQSSFQDRSFRPNKINYRIFFRLYLPGFLCTMFSMHNVFYAQCFYSQRKHNKRSCCMNAVESHFDTLLPLKS